MLTPMQAILVEGINTFADLAAGGFESMKELAQAVKKSFAELSKGHL